ncbi:MAG TPA: D-2-hydroxyacid dehydrogenase [Verrucomicrobiae bacterium]|nr:D-2-hydroxyacid dehydrogenase [Verrucomicrobiae bacterium]
MRLARNICCLLLLAAAGRGQTAKKKIVIVGLDDAAFSALKRSSPANVRLESPLPANFIAEVADADALIAPQLSRETLQTAKRLAWVHILNAGVEDVLPLVKDSNIALTNLKVVLGPEVADHAMALLLALTRGLYETIPARGKWEQPENIGQLTELRGRTAVIVGMGGVGSQIAERAAGFEMTIIGVDPKDAAPGGPAKQMVKPEQLSSVLPQADVVFLTVPATPATKGMIGAAQFQQMKRGAYFIAVSRGAVYSMDALVQALSSHRLAGAGVDVTDPEPLPKNHPLWKFKNVVITPHIAGASDRSLGRVLDLLRENIRRFAAGEPLLNTVDKTKGY